MSIFGDVFNTKTYISCWTVIVANNRLNTMACSPAEHLLDNVKNILTKELINNAYFVFT